MKRSKTQLIQKFPYRRKLRQTFSKIIKKRQKFPRSMFYKQTRCQKKSLLLNNTLQMIRRTVHWSQSSRIPTQPFWERSWHSTVHLKFMTFWKRFQTSLTLKLSRWTSTTVFRCVWTFNRLNQESWRPRSQTVLHLQQIPQLRQVMQQSIQQTTEQGLKLMEKYRKKQSLFWERFPKKHESMKNKSTTILKTKSQSLNMQWVTLTLSRLSTHHHRTTELQQFFKSSKI